MQAIHKTKVKHRCICPKCKKSRWVGYFAAWIVKKKNLLCRSCGNSKERKGPRKSPSARTLKLISMHRKGKCRGKDHWIFGKSHSLSVRRKMSRLKSKFFSKPENRKKHSNILKRSEKFIAQRMMNVHGVNLDNGQKELIQKWNKLGFQLIINFPVRCGESLFFLDGYDKSKNVVIEIDSAYHNTRVMRQSDAIRQRKIIRLLKPKKFWRFDSVNRVYSQVA